jgi:hypothetical protein
MTDDKPILSYALPAHSAGPSTELEPFVFAAPAPGEQIRFIRLAMAICMFGAALVLGFGIRAWLRGESGRLLIAIGGAAAAMFVVLWLIPELRRLRRFGDAPIEFKVQDRTLVISAPLQWGEHPRTIDVRELEPLTVVNTYSTVAGISIFCIMIHRSGWYRSAWPVRVAVSDVGVLSRAVADLNQQITTAAAG